MTLWLVLAVMIAIGIAFVAAPAFRHFGKGAGRGGLRERILAAALGAFMAAGAFGIYLTLGAPELGTGFSGAGEDGAGPAGEEGSPSLPSIEVMVERLQARLAAEPDDLNGWATLGQSFMVLGRFAEAEAAYRKAIALGPGIPSLLAGLGEALTLAADGAVTEEAHQSFLEALAGDPQDLISRFYLGDFAFQRGAVAEALERWTEVFAMAPADTPWLPVLEERIRAAASELGQEPPAILSERAVVPAPSLAESFGQMSADEQTAMIESMVSGLAAKLRENPGDLAGWEKLGRSYMVLGRPTLAAEAYANVVAARPDDKEAQERLTEALVAAAVSEGRPLEGDVLEALERLVRLDPENSTALFFLGEAARERGDAAAAREYWQRLLARLPPDSEDARTVRDKLQSLG